MNIKFRSVTGPLSVYIGGRDPISVGLIRVGTLYIAFQDVPNGEAGDDAVTYRRLFPISMGLHTTG